MTDNFIDDIEFLSLTRDEFIEVMGIVKKILRRIYQKRATVRFI